MKPSYYAARCLLFLTVSTLIGGCTAKNLTLERQAAYQAYSAGDFDQAAERFEQLVLEVPKDAELWFRLGNSYARSERPRQAIASYENSLLRDPALTKAWYNMGIIHLRSALKSFLDMQEYVKDSDPVGTRAKEMSDEILILLEGTPADNDQEE